MTKAMKTLHYVSSTLKVNTCNCSYQPQLDCARCREQADCWTLAPEPAVPEQHQTPMPWTDQQGPQFSVEIFAKFCGPVCKILRLTTTFTLAEIIKRYSTVQTIYIAKLTMPIAHQHCSTHKTFSWKKHRQAFISATSAVILSSLTPYMQCSSCFWTRTWWQ